MHRKKYELLPYNPEIEKTCRARNKIRTQKIKALKMAENENKSNLIASGDTPFIFMVSQISKKFDR